MSALVVSRSRFRRWAVILLAAILALHLFVHAVDRFNVLGETLLRRLGNVGTENTFPTWLSAVGMLAVALLCWLIGRAASEDRRYWFGLAVILAVLSVDEIASFHEAVSGPVRDLLELDGLLYFAWVIPALVLVSAVAAVFWRFMFRLPPSLRNQLVLAAVLFVLGAVGFELFEGLLSSRDEKDTLLHFLFVALEETMEMAAVVVAIDALIGHLAATGQRVALAFEA